MVLSRRNTSDILTLEYAALIATYTYNSKGFKALLLGQPCFMIVPMFC